MTPDPQEQYTGGSGGNGGRNGGGTWGGAADPNGDDDIRRSLLSLNQQVLSLMQQLADKKAGDHSVRPIAKLPEPAPYKGDPEDLERFLGQLTNIFNLDQAYFRNDSIKIQYASNLLYHSDKFSSPAKWYKA